MKLRVAVVLSVAALALSGCSTSEPVRDEQKYLEQVNTLIGPDDGIVEDSFLLELGDTICLYAEDQGVSLAEAGEAVREISGNDGDLILDPAIESSHHLCPGLS